MSEKHRRHNAKRRRDPEYQAKQRHTPGPWHHKQLIGCDDRGWSVFYSHSYGTKRIDDKGEMSEANARLIAAAPDMLEALRTILIAYEARAERGINPEFVRAVIAKATGGAG